MRTKPKALIIGAGAVGRGLIAPILLDSGYRVLFADTNLELVDALDTKRWYPLAGRGQVRWIGPVSCAYINDIHRATHDLEIDTIFVSVRPENLKNAAQTIGVLKVAGHVNDNVTTYVVENMTEAAEKSRISNSRNAIANVIVPNSPFQEDDVTYTVYDPNMELVLQKREGDEEIISKARYVDEEKFAFEWDLKLHLHCSLHAVVAWLGIKHEIEYVHEVIEHERTSCYVDDVVNGYIKALSRKYPDKANDIIGRALHERLAMKDSLMMDDVYRVARDPIRKLAPDDRLVGSLYFVSNNIPKASKVRTPGCLPLLDATIMAMRKAGLTVDSLLNLPTWQGVSVDKYADILAELRDHYEKV